MFGRSRCTHADSVAPRAAATARAERRELEEESRPPVGREARRDRRLELGPADAACGLDRAPGSQRTGESDEEAKPGPKLLEHLTVSDARTEEQQLVEEDLPALTCEHVGGEVLRNEKELVAPLEGNVCRSAVGRRATHVIAAGIRNVATGVAGQPRSRAPVDVLEVGPE